MIIHRKRIYDVPIPTLMKTIERSAFCDYVQMEKNGGFRFPMSLPFSYMRRIQLVQISGKMISLQNGTEIEYRVSPFWGFYVLLFPFLLGLLEGIVCLLQGKKSMMFCLVGTGIILLILMAQFWCEWECARILDEKLAACVQ